jgi:single-stranded-DNA-specific exonuclease
MPEPELRWQIQAAGQPPAWYRQLIQKFVSGGSGRYLAQLLWQRGLHNPKQIAEYLDASVYQPSSPFAFGQEMDWAISRLQQAYEQKERVAIWGDFDADGVTATAVLWDGLGQFFQPQKQLFYYIPNRLSESHGLSRQGLNGLKAKDCQVVITCDTGSTNLEEIEYAKQLGMEVIVTDHHTLPAARPAVTAIVNPRSLPATHPFASLSGVAVAYKLVEALYERLPEVPQLPLDRLLDLVAIGLIADLVELKGDCRYLAQRGIEQLQKQSTPATATRPGIAKLLEFCKRTGDRPTDISFGLGPRINAVSRIQGDAHFCVELLTSQDRHLCTHLAEATELANARRKALQKEVLLDVRDRIAQLDLSTTYVIVLADPQWQPGILGLVAGQIAQEYGRPTILLSTEGWSLEEKAEGRLRRESFDERSAERGQKAGGLGESLLSVPSFLPPVPLARGSARSANNIDLYELIQGQQHLLYRFGGHPFAAGLSLPVENLALFTEAVNQQLRQRGEAIAPAVTADLRVTVKELGKALFQELKLLEPCGIGNPVPRLLIQNCWFAQVRNAKIKDRRGQKVEYIKTEFELWDDSSQTGFPGTWWGHYRDDIPTERCDAIAELDFNAYERRYEVRLVAVRPHSGQLEQVGQVNHSRNMPWILDWRGHAAGVQCSDAAGSGEQAVEPLVMTQVPGNWAELQAWMRRARQEERPLAIAFAPPVQLDPVILWPQLVGIAKFLSRTGRTVNRQQLLDKLGIRDRALQQGFRSLTYLGFALTSSDQGIHIQATPNVSAQTTAPELREAVRQFAIAVREEFFQQQYFAQLPLSAIQAISTPTLSTNDQDKPN